MSPALTRVTATAPGKINLSLRVGGRDERGYHALATVFQAVDLLETITASATDTNRLSLTVTSHVRGEVPTDGTNLALRAADLLRTECGVRAGAELHIEKRVPIAGGMGGGSADAAAALVALNRLWGLGLSAEDLAAFGARLGADVPFALHGGTALGTGNGTELQAIHTAEVLTWLLVAPGGHLSTPQVFTVFDEIAEQSGTVVPTIPTPDAAQIAALGAGDLPAIAASLANDLHAPALRLSPELGPLLEGLMEAGALAAVISGSGPTLAALVRAAEHGQSLREAFGPAHPQAECLVCTGPVPGARVISES